MKKMFVMLFLSLITACAWGSGTSYSEQLQQWIGHSEYQLYQEWGTPAQSFYVTPYEKVVTYVRTSAHGSNHPYGNQLYYQGMDAENSWWDKMFGAPTAKQPQDYYCKTSFTIRNSLIVNFNFNGDACTANN